MTDRNEAIIRHGAVLDDAFWDGAQRIPEADRERATQMAALAIMVRAVMKASDPEHLLCAVLRLVAEVGPLRGMPVELMTHPLDQTGRPH